MVVPTRNRSTLAQRAIASVVEQGVPNVRLLVSDNSTEERDRTDLSAYCAKLDPAVVRYVAAPNSMPMAAHWDWAIIQARALFPASHFTILTDRMLFKRGELARLSTLAANHPAMALTYNHDRVDDFSIPIRLQMCEWSGSLLEIPTTHLLRLSARAHYTPALPRMLNCVMPASTLEEVSMRFGSVFASLAPDFCFAYRCLEVIPSILYYDKAVLIHHSLGRSTGENFLRGRNSRESSDYLTQGNGTIVRFSTPLPEVHTVMNAILHEYCQVKAVSTSAKFPEVDRFSYLGAIDRGISQVQDRSKATEMRAMLKSAGWRTTDRMLWYLMRAKELALGNPLAAVHAVGMRLFAGRRTQHLWMLLSRTGLQPPPSPWFRFPSTDEALRYAVTYPRHRSTTHRHLWALMGRGMRIPVASSLGNGEKAAAPIGRGCAQ